MWYCSKQTAHSERSQSWTTDAHEPAMHEIVWKKIKHTKLSKLSHGFEAPVTNTEYSRPFGFSCCRSLSGRTQTNTKQILRTWIIQSPMVISGCEEWSSSRCRAYKPQRRPPFGRLCAICRAMWQALFLSITRMHFFIFSRFTDILYISFQLL